MKPTASPHALDFSRPIVMTIVNVTPDSFYGASRTFDEHSIIRRVEQAVDDGASIIDIGGYSSRPGAADVEVGEEIRRVELGIRCIREVSRDITISVDTFRAEVAAHAIAAERNIMINDISAGELDPAMLRTVAEAEVPYIAMNMRGTPATMQQLTDYEDITGYVKSYFGRKTEQMLECGIHKENILFDPGFGFAKSTEQNYELLGRLSELCATGYPVVAGVSRKSMIYKVLNTTPDNCLAGTTALHWELLRQGVSVLRVHDTREAADTIKIFEKFKSLNRK